MASLIARLSERDILTALFVLSATQNPQIPKTEIKAHNYQLHEAVHKVSHTHPLLRESFIFSDCTPDPYSPPLEEAITELHFAGLLCRPHSDWQWLRVKPAAFSDYEELIERKLSEGDKKTLSSAARALSQQLEYREQ